MVKEKILEMIESSNGKLTFEALLKRLEIDKSVLEKIILELKLDGKILETSNKYSIFPSDMRVGTICVTKSGNKVIFYDGKLIPLASNFFNYVIINDTVSYKINDNGEAELTSIIDRKIRDVTCKVISNGKKKKLECFHKGLNVSLPKEELDKFSNGDIIMVHIGVNDIECGHCDCSFKKLIGHANEPNIDEIVIAANYGASNEYSDEYLSEVANISSEISEKEIKKRRDLRDIRFITIDCASAKDLDDGVYGYKLENGNYRVYVTIADVSHFVKLYSKIFDRAYEMGNSFYINNTVFHMLHPLLSNGVCSLNQDEDKLTKTVVMDIDNEGNIIDFEICKSIVRSRKRMDYPTVDKIIINGDVPLGYEKHIDTIKVLNEVATLLEINAIKNGKLNFPSTENIKEYDEFGNVIKVVDDKYEDTPSEKLIENLMIAANRCVASYILTCCMPSIYRIEYGPNVKKVNSLLKMVNENDDIKIKFKLLETAKHPKAVQGILNKLRNMEEYPILATMLLQFMERAEYSNENVGHYALGLDAYTHFTSPIRRLCDLLVHMILDILLEDFDLVNEIDFDKLEEFLEQAAKQASKMERQADAAEYEADRLAIIKSMKKDVGEEFDAVVLDVDDVIRLKVHGVDCFVKYKKSI